MPKQSARNNVDESAKQIPLNAEIKVEQQQPEQQTANSVICHRKSERRRVARDIFLVFEEPPRRGRGRGGATAKKSKFGHLKVEDPSRRTGVGGGGGGGGAAKSFLLRDIKNEPKCYLYNNNSNIHNNNSCSNDAAATETKRRSAMAMATPTPTTAATKLKVGTTTSPLLLPPASVAAPVAAALPQTPSSPLTAATALTSATLVQEAAYKVKHEKRLPGEESHLERATTPAPVPVETASAPDAPQIVARVNPIFLWVKQEDTRIVEVRCEDYDKRNRIRITKTNNGWQAIPRTDPTSSRIVRFLHNQQQQHRPHQSQPRLLQQQAAVKCEMYASIGDHRETAGMAAETPLLSMELASMEFDKQSFHQETPHHYPLAHHYPLQQQEALLAVAEAPPLQDMCELSSISNFFSSLVAQHPTAENAVMAAATAMANDDATPSQQNVLPEQQQLQQEAECLVNEDRSSSSSMLSAILTTTTTKQTAMDRQSQQQQPTQEDTFEHKVPLWPPLEAKAATMQPTTARSPRRRRKAANKKRRKKNKGSAGRRLRRNSVELKKVACEVRGSDDDDAEEPLPAGIDIRPISPLSPVKATTDHGEAVEAELQSNARAAAGQLEVKQAIVDLCDAQATVDASGAAVAADEEDEDAVLLLSGAAEQQSDTKVPLEDEINIFSDSGLGSQEAQDTTPSKAAPTTMRRSEAPLTDLAVLTKRLDKWSGEEDNDEVANVVASGVLPLASGGASASDDDDEAGAEDRTYQRTPPLQLCPKTGLFVLIPNEGESDEAADNAEQTTTPNKGGDGAALGTADEGALAEATSKGSSADTIPLQMAASKGGDINLIDIIETANLKDLLDDAEMFCDGNGSFDVSGADDVDFIDRLVKRSCESSLLQMHLHHGNAKDGPSDPMQSLDAAIPPSSGGGGLVLTPTSHLGLVVKTPLNAEPLKSLSFNEVGEIEGINDDEAVEADFVGLYQANGCHGGPAATALSPPTITIEDLDEDVAVLQPHAVSAVAGMPHSTAAVRCHLGAASSSPRQLDDEHTIVQTSVAGESLVSAQETAKDLTYKTHRVGGSEDIAMANEASRNQCAVTSTSDVGAERSPLAILSNELRLPPLAMSMEVSTSETIKNLILEQFMKLNATMTATAANLSQSLTAGAGVGVVHKSEPLEACQQPLPAVALTPTSTMETVTLTTPTKSSRNSSLHRPAKFIETVLIDDEEEDGLDEDEAEAVQDNDRTSEGDVDSEEPQKKRMRSGLPCANAAKASADNTTASSSLDLASGRDPDPLTQLRLLIRNTQWKVPDPILVPKDRLGAVLASPAREIPLLITTRPELRLPEAFAYPEIIQNPNILVISMAQLEAILNNDMESLASSKTDGGSKAGSKQQPTKQPHRHHHLDDVEGYGQRNKTSAGTVTPLSPRELKHESPGQKEHHHLNTPNRPQHPPPHQRLQAAAATKTAKAALPRLQQPLTVPPPTKSLLYAAPPSPDLVAAPPPDLNAATLAVLNQMLWLPYFGQLSQELFKTIAQPLNAAKELAAPPQIVYQPTPPPPPSAAPPPPQSSAAAVSATTAAAQLGGLTQLDELYKFYVQQLSTRKGFADSATSAAAAAALPTPPPTSTPLPLSLLPPHAPAPPPPTQQELLASYAAPSLATTAALRNPLEAALLQKLFENQMQQFLEFNTFPQAVAAEPSQQAALMQQAASSAGHNSGYSQPRPHTPITAASLEAKAKDEQTKRRHTAAMMSALAGTERRTARESKPRLTCKSLTNLLEPVEFGALPHRSAKAVAAAAPVVATHGPGQTAGGNAAKLTGLRARKFEPEQRPHADERGAVNSNTLAYLGDHSGGGVGGAGSGGEAKSTTNRLAMEARLKRVTRAQTTPSSSTANQFLPQTAALLKAKSPKPAVGKRGEGGGGETGAASDGKLDNSKGRAADGGHGHLQQFDANAPLWHPLFGSNGKGGAGYTSPWQWTTVTASGE